MSSRRNQFMLGARDILPMLIGAAPLAVIYGGLAVNAGLTAWQTLGMSALVFAGSAQFIAVSLMGAGAGMLVILLTTLVVNLRHALYSASMQPYIRHLPKRWRVPLAFGLTDESYAVAVQHYLRGSGENDHWYFFGASLAMYLNWIAFTGVGVAFGQAVPGLADWGLDFAMLATFIGIVVPSLRNYPQLAAALVAAAVALACNGFPYKLGLMAAALAGIVVGIVLERRAIQAGEVVES